MHADSVPCQQIERRCNIACDPVTLIARDEKDYLFVARDNIDGHADASSWLTDSGVTQHMTCSKACLKNYRAIKPVQMHLADDGTVEAIGSGKSR